MPRHKDESQLLSCWVQRREATGADGRKLRRPLPSGAAESRYILSNEIPTPQLVLTASLRLESTGIGYTQRQD